MSGNQSWALSEFDTHKQHLAGISGQVKDAGTHLDAARGGHDKAFGILFGGLVGFVLDELSEEVKQFSDSLGTAMEASGTGIEFARSSYQQTEQDGVDRSKSVESELQKQKGRVK